MKKNIVYILFAVILIGLIGALFAIQITAKASELEKIFKTFGCNCCDGSLYSSDSFCAGGIREEIRGLQAEYRGQELFNETTKLLGISHILDHNLRQSTLDNFRASPPTTGAVMEVKDTFVNFGNISESKIAFVMKDFTIKNIGDEDLYLYQVRTSCSCLNAKFVNDDKESPIWSRFSYPYGMTFKLAPQESTRLRVTYDARVNSYFRGHEVRFVYVDSNDVVNPTVQFDIEVIHSD